MDIDIRPDLRLPDSEISYETSRSSGPGGQNVNKLETRVSLLFDVEGSPTLSDTQKRRLKARLGNRINREGVLRVVAQEHRSQKANREAALERFLEMMAKALERPRRRRDTRASAGSRRRRLKSKKERSQIKKLRRSPRRDD